MSQAHHRTTQATHKLTCGISTNPVKIVGFYKGVTPPLLTDAIINAIVFGVYGLSLRALVGISSVKANEQRNTEHSSNTKATPSMWQTYIAGCSVSLPAALVMSPVEMIKSRLQIQSKAGAVYSGVVDCIRKTWTHSGIRGIYCGLGATYIRDIPSFGIYFVVYDQSKKLAAKYFSHVDPLTATESVSPFVSAIAGGITGTICWASSYPADVVKTRMQVQQLQPSAHHIDGYVAADTARRYTGFWDCARSSYRAEGARVFFNGLTPTLVRAFPVNAALFLAYELTMALLN
jgi:solute carrier family 25 (mitochondrial carnitine/acylcarnitine transporter), member 20/29